MLMGEQVYLRPLCLEDATDEYINWMNDYEIVKYTDSKVMLHTKESIQEFIKIGIDSTRNYIFGIVDKKTHRHIGNIKLGSINWQHRYGDIGLIIGLSEYHGRGIATEAISLVSEFAFKQLGLHRVISGAYENNIGSIRAFEKSGFKQYGRATKAYMFEGAYMDGIMLEKLNPYEGGK